MRHNRNYQQAVRQINERLMDVQALIGDATVYMAEDRPQAAWDALDNAKQAIEGAMTTAKWATTLPTPEEE